MLVEVKVADTREVAKMAQAALEARAPVASPLLMGAALVGAEAEADP